MQKVTMAVGLRKYCATVSILKKGFKQEKYRIEQLCNSFLGTKFIDEVPSIDIATYRDQRLTEKNPRSGRVLSPSSVRLELSLLSNFFDICVIEWGYAALNPVKNVRKPKNPPGRDRRLTAREDRQLLRSSHTHRNKEIYSIIVLALSTAMRQGEILALKWDHINLQAGIAHLPMTKNGSKRDVPLSEVARGALIRLGVKSTGRVFSYTNDGLKSTWRFLVQKLGIQDLHFHDLRHEAISRLFELGTLNVVEIAAISGHKSMNMLKRYTHLNAAHLVPKLDGSRSKARIAVVNSLVPYPAHKTIVDGKVTLRILDFEDLSVEGEDFELVQDQASYVLMREILRCIKLKLPVPAPDQYLDVCDERDIVMIDPLPFD